ncbi:MAG: N-methyl-L-tryptophan oxidase [Candidatus Melainabacteria bacterium HGW-Melainabacteria-1]|nr:MAG: N-methyl-L-tryptophan oxidase [Candidatus Melainabacteria bacterium HGW-Melainabacteria-1]
MPRYDIAVIGLGAMGSAALWQMAAAGLRVIGFDQHLPPHTLGSSHGQSRVIREAYFEHPAYVPLLQRAYPLWQRLQQETGEELLQITGGLMMGPPNGELVAGCLESARRYDLAHQLLHAGQIPGPFCLPDDFQAVSEPRAGLLYPERCIQAMLNLARAAGASIQAPDPVRNWQALPEGFEIIADSGSYRARKLVICAGAWLTRLLPELALPLTVTRQSLFWFDALDPDAFALGSFPVFLIEVEPGAYLYGFPDTGTGVKVALHQPGRPLEPDLLALQQLEAAELSQMQALLARYLPLANGSLRDSAICMYTNAPDGHFRLDTHPAHPDLLLVSPCSGHGFKFAAVIGDEVSRWAQHMPPGDDLSLFRF